VVRELQVQAERSQDRLGGGDGVSQRLVAALGKHEALALDHHRPHAERGLLDGVGAGAVHGPPLEVLEHDRPTTEAQPADVHPADRFSGHAVDHAAEGVSLTVLDHHATEVHGRAAEARLAEGVVAGPGMELEGAGLARDLRWRAGRLRAPVLGSVLDRLDLHDGERPDHLWGQEVGQDTEVEGPDVPPTAVPQVVGQRQPELRREG
jgi:hypothetical protein